jgi:alkaline phosphatase
VADGAGLAHWSAARLYSDSLVVLGLPVVGLMESGNTSNPEPESASSATALATGVRTHYHGVGVGPDSLPRPTVLEAARDAGLATGLVTTTELVDATPAAFAAHVGTRSERQEIARQLAAAGVDVLLGDGARWFSPAGRSDSLDLLAGMRESYPFADGPADLERLAADPAVTRLAGFFPMDSVSDPAARRPTLAVMAAAALAVLDRDPDGFFLLVESEHTDHAGHGNAPLERIAAETIEVDRAVRVVLAYRERRPGTLVVVLGDHETGGLSIRWNDEAAAWVADWSTTHHTAAMVPVFAVGPGAERFAGTRSNDGVGRILLERVSRAAPEHLTDDD